MIVSSQFPDSGAPVGPWEGRGRTVMGDVTPLWVPSTGPVENSLEGVSCECPSPRLKEMGLRPPQAVITRGRKLASECLTSRGISAWTSQLKSPSLWWR